VDKFHWKPHYILTDGEKCGDVYTIDEFQEMVDDGSVMDNDGHAHWSTLTHEYRTKNIYDFSDFVRPSAFNPSVAPEDATHVIWFNK
jgi:hypothetical protein